MFTLIESKEDLDFLNKELLNKSYLGVDTEFRRTTKENMRLALLQVNDEEEIYLIDTVSIQDPGEHASFLFSDSVTKIFHSCKEDLEAIYSWTKKKMTNIFDTQVANSFLNGDFTIGYQGIVEQELGIILNKNETRSNWMRRPLSDSQLKYAALDVEYLIHLYKIQKNELSKSCKLDWLDQDIQRLLQLTFCENPSSTELERKINKAKENELLIKLNEVVEEISIREKINKTLFFSKKAQKDLLRLAIKDGLDLACNQITPWRSKLIKEDLLKLLK